MAIKMGEFFVSILVVKNQLLNGRLYFNVQVFNWDTIKGKNMLPVGSIHACFSLKQPLLISNVLTFKGNKL